MTCRRRARVQAFGQRFGDALLVTGSKVVVGPGATGERYQGARHALAMAWLCIARLAVAGDKLTKFVTAAGDDCAARDALAVLHRVRLHRRSMLPLLGTYIAWRIEQYGKRRVRPAPGCTGSGRKPGADPDEATYIADQGHAGVDRQAAAFQGDLRSADYRVIVARVSSSVVSRAPEGRKRGRWDDSGVSDTKTKRKASLQ